MCIKCASYPLTYLNFGPRTNTPAPLHMLASAPYPRHVNATTDVTTIAATLKDMYYPAQTQYSTLAQSQRQACSKAINIATAAPTSPRRSGWHRPQQRSCGPLTKPLPLVQPLTRRHDPNLFICTYNSRTQRSGVVGINITNMGLHPGHGPHHRKSGTDDIRCTYHSCRTSGCLGC